MEESLSNRGIYLHIPFCRKKCAYCDFYSACVSETQLDKYVSALSEEIIRWGGYISRPIDSIYIGGGTPSLLGRRIIPLTDTLRKAFNITRDCEITAEMNPSGDCLEFLEAAKAAGVNRLSIGMQSGNDDELKLLGRTHNSAEAKKSFIAAREKGFRNISLDLMIALPGSDKEKLRKSIDYILSLDPEHISAYILKVEPNTAFGKSNLSFPDDDAQADQYLYMCEKLEKAGYGHYEISNFSKSGYESRHNLKYWKDEEYLGIGPAAHSYIDGKRFYYPRDMKGFMENPQTVEDGTGGSAEEKLMLGLRLSDGVDLSDYPQTRVLTDNLIKAGLGRTVNGRFCLTDKGMLVSNSIITEISELII